MIPRIHGRSNSEGPKTDDAFDEPYIPRMIGRSAPDAGAKRGTSTSLRFGANIDKEIWNLLRDYPAVVISPQALADEIKSRGLRSLDADRKK